MNPMFITVSSEQALFPKVNAVDDIRTRPWKPAGNFEITDNNNKLYIDDGSPKTITLTNGSYTYATLAAHIQTRLNASSSGWTCTYDFGGGTFKYSLAHMGTAVLRTSETTDAVFDTIGFITAPDVTDTTWEANEQRNHTSEWIEFFLGGARNCTFFAVISDVTKQFTLSNQASLRLQADDIPDNWDNPAFDITLSISDTGIFRFFDDIEDTEFRYWRFTFEDRTNPLGPEGFEIGHVYLGDYLTSTNSNVNNGFRKDIIDSSAFVQSVNGQKYFSQNPIYKSFSSVTIGLLSTSEREMLEQLFFNVGISRPWFISFDPLLKVSDSEDDLTCFVYFDSKLELDHVFQRMFRTSISLVEAL